MVKIEVSEHGSLDRALKFLKKKFEKHGTVAELRKRREFVKHSVNRREEIKSAKYRQTFNNDN